MTPIDDILSRALSGGSALHTLVRDNLLDAIARGIIGQEQLLLYARLQLQTIDPLLAGLIHDSLLLAWLKAAQQPAVEAVKASGPAPLAILEAAKASRPEKPLVKFPQIETAVKNLAERQVMTRREFDQLDQDAKRAAFTVARVVKEDSLKKIRNHLADAAATGNDQESFDKAVDRTLGENGEASLTPHHLENILRTNLLTAHAAGQDAMLDHPLVADEFPYVLYVAVHDTRVRDDHLEMERLGIQGTAVYRRDDPIWELFRPPWDYNCRCHLIPLSVEDAARRGIREAINWLDGIYPLTPAWVEPPPFMPPEGWTRQRRRSIVAVI